MPHPVVEHVLATLLSTYCVPLGPLDMVRTPEQVGLNRRVPVVGQAQEHGGVAYPATGPLFLADVAPVQDEQPVSGALRVRLYGDRDVGAPTRAGARLTADRLLSAAGVATTWVSCEDSPCAPVAESVTDIVVILRSRAPYGRTGAACGAAARGEHHATGTIVVSVACVAGVASRLSRSPDHGRHPQLVMPRHDDLVGAVIAHEVAHILGVAHAPSGVMRPELDASDIIALRTGHLSFRRQDAVRLREALAPAGRAQAAHHP
jgi:hypothetical protein